MSNAEAIKFSQAPGRWRQLEFTIRECRKLLYCNLPYTYDRHDMTLH